VNPPSSDRSSAVRKRALARLAREQPAAYTGIYEQVRPDAAGRHHARGKAWTLLRRRHPGRYFELYAEEMAAPGSEIPAVIRTRSWQRASARLADLRAAAYRESYDGFRAQGMPHSRARERAVAVLRDSRSGLFARLLSDEYELWLAAEGNPAATGQRLEDAFPPHG
jgi:hypothetical protein